MRVAILIAASALFARAAIAAGPAAAGASTDSASAEPVGHTTTSSSAAMIKVQQILGQQPGGEPRVEEPAPAAPASATTDTAAPAPAAATTPNAAPAPADPSLAKKSGGGEAGQPAPSSQAPANQLVGAAAGAVPETGRPYYVRGLAQYRMLAVSDDDPENDRSIIWAVEGGYKVFPKAAVFARVGVLERFVAEPDESGFLFRDLVLGFKYTWTQALDQLGFEGKSLTITHGVNAYLPTSRASINQDLYFAPELVTRAIYEAFPGFSAELAVSFQYRFHKYAERAGFGAGMNRQLSFGPSFSLDYVIAQSEEYGAIDAGTSIYTNYRKSYASSENFEAESSSQSFWTQTYGWDFFVSYAPNNWLAATLSLEQNAPVLRDGLVNVRLPNRDETEFVFTLSAQY